MTGSVCRALAVPIGTVGRTDRTIGRTAVGVRNTSGTRERCCVVIMPDAV